jgi:hypothetical protein
VARLGRPGGLSAVGKQELWDRWRAGESISPPLLGHYRSLPALFTGCSKLLAGSLRLSGVGEDVHSSPAEREEISRGLATGESLRSIAARLGRSASNQSDSFSTKLRWVGQVCSWHCSPFRALFSVLNSPRNRRKSSACLTQLGRVSLVGDAKLVGELADRYLSKGAGQPDGLGAELLQASRVSTRPGQFQAKPGLAVRRYFCAHWYV